jgi:hypothetical protein
LLAKKLDMDCVNLARSGQGNEYIYSSILNYITKNDKSKIGLIIPAWTQTQRRDYQQGWLGTWLNKRIDSHGDIFYWTRKHLEYCVSFQILCERYNLDYIQVQMLSPYQDWLGGLRPGDADPTYPKGFRHKYPGDPYRDNRRIIQIINDYEDRLNIKKYLGWPLAEEFEGYSLQKRLIGIEKATMLSKEDHHPSEKGHQVIAEFIYDRLG